MQENMFPKSTLELSSLTSAYTGDHTDIVWTREGKPVLQIADSLGRLDRL